LRIVTIYYFTIKARKLTKSPDEKVTWKS